MSLAEASRAPVASAAPRAADKVVPTLGEHLAPGAPKRALAIDGGGIRGALALSYLERIETLLRERYGRRDLRLCDYYDLIGGTSTGAIVASGLATGMEVSELIALYRELGKRIFKPRFTWLLRAKYSGKKLGEILKQRLGDNDLGSDCIRTGLAVVTKRLDTGSPWVLVNNPKARYFHEEPGSQAVPNSKLKLWKLVQASAAAPTFFPPVLMQVGPREHGLFVDGGVSTYNNPSIALLMVAGLKGFGFNWKIASDHLLLTSVGTGALVAKPAETEFQIMRAHIRPFLMQYYPAMAQGMIGLIGMIEDGDLLGRILLQWLSETGHAENLDSLLGDLEGELLAGHGLLTYSRYNLSLDPRKIRDTLGVTLTKKEERGLYAMDDANMVEPLLAIGRASASGQIDDKDFPAGFDPPVLMGRAGAPEARASTA
jgi:hypothetical protein